MSMRAVMASILEQANKGHSLALAVSYSLRYDKHHSNPTQFRFRLHSSPPDTIHHFLWNLWQPLLQVVPLDTLEDRMQTAVCHVDPARRDPTSPLPHNISLTKPLNKEKSYKKYLESECSDQWRKHLGITLSDPPDRVQACAYVHWHLHNKHKRSMYKPAPYLTHQCCPLSIRTPPDPHTA